MIFVSHGALSLLLSIALLCSTASAHDRHGNAAMHQDVLVQFGPQQVNVTFTIETNDEGRIIEAIAMDANGDGRLAPDEQAACFARLDAQLREGLQITIAGRDVPLSPSNGVELSPPARKTFHFSSGMVSPAAMRGSVEVHNDNFPDWPGRTTLRLDAAGGMCLQLDQTGDTDARGRLSLVSPESQREAGTHTNDIVRSDWSWRSRLLRLECLPAVLLVIIMLVAKGRLSRWQRIIGWLAAITCAAATMVTPPWLNHHQVSLESWRREFLHYHERLSTALARYHQDGQDGTLSSFGSGPAMKRLADSTRVIDTNDEKSGVFELRRVRPLTTTMLSVEEGIFQTTIRIHHEWRAIGVVRHSGHPHERVRDFACDYTLRVTSQGFLLLDCSEWHQLPDEPVE